jgi:hypothetical protein
MLKNMTRAALVVAALGYSSSLFALADVQLLHGRRWMSSETDGEKNSTPYQHTMVAAHLGLLPIVSIGGSFSYLDATSADKKASDNKSDSGTEIALDILAQLSFVPVITPYARLNAPLYSRFTTKSKSDVDVTFEGVPLETYWIGVGAKYSLLPLVAISAELGRGVFMGRVKELKQDGDDILDDYESFKNRKAIKMDQFLVGIEVGL